MNEIEKLESNDLNYIGDGINQDIFNVLPETLTSKKRTLKSIHADMKKMGKLNESGMDGVESHFNKKVIEKMLEEELNNSLKNNKIIEDAEKEIKESGHRATALLAALIELTK